MEKLRRGFISLLFLHIFPQKAHNFYIVFCYDNIMKGDDIIEVKIIGSDCSNGIKLLKMVHRATEEIEEEVIVKDLKKDKKYGIVNYPALMINNKKVSEGKVLTVREIKKLLLSY